MKNILIIGGSSGIGYACTKVFSNNGWNVFATFFSNKKIVKKQTKVTWSFLDISDTSSIENFLDRIPKLDAVIVCAAKNKTASLDVVTEDIDLIFDINIISQIKVAAFLKPKLKQKSSIVFFSSITGNIGSERRIAYSSSKAAIGGLVKSLAADLSPNVRVNAICPGYINTAQYHKNSTIKVEERRKKILLERLGSPEEVANLALFLSSKNASYINGQSISIDGGIF